MATTQSPDYSPHVINGVYEVASHHVEKSLFDMIRSCFTGGKMRGGNYYMNRSCSLLKEHYASLQPEDLNAILRQLKK
jgi:hypothetical protein